MLDETAVHILGGGIGGTVGAVLTCPLEVIKVRLQSSQGVTLHSGSPSGPLEGNRSSAHVARCIWSSVTSNSAASHTSQFEHVDICSQSGTSDKYPIPNVAQSQLPPTQPPTTTRSHHSVSMDTLVDSARETTARSARSTYTGFRRSVLLRCLVDISRNEGFGALFKGLVPTLLGVLPSRGIYFCAYHKGQVLFENHFPSGSSGVYLCAAGFGSITASSLTNPIWFVKTRLQLDSRPGKPPITVAQIIRNTWHQDGIRGFYRGVSASYVGSLETALNFVLYENIKAQLLWWDMQRRQQITITPAGIETNSASPICPGVAGVTKPNDLRGSRGGSKLNASSDMVLCMIASACSKVVAITALYPHEVVRTRLREAHGHYRGFWRTLRQVAQEEGLASLYRGMGTHYIRQVPNSCIMIGTYEVVVFLLQSWGFTKIT